MERSKTPLPSPFGVQTAITFYRIRFGEHHYGADWHDFPELLYVEEGFHRVLVDGELFELKEGDAILYAPNAYHTGPSQSKALVNIISFETDFVNLSQICNRIIPLNALQKQLLSRIMAQGLECFAPASKESGLCGLVLREGVDALQLMRLKNNLELLLIELYGTQAKKRSQKNTSNQENFKAEQLSHITDYLRDNLQLAPTQEQIAAKCGISVSALKTLFRNQLGCGPITYQLSLRVGEAKRMIRESSLNFTQIAEQLGFGSIHHFSKIFKEKTGLSPREYAKTVYKK